MLGAIAYSRQAAATDDAHSYGPGTHLYSLLEREKERRLG